MSFSVLKDPRQPEVHASTLIISRGKLLSAWFGGTKEGYPDTKIWLSTRDLSSDDKPWSTARPIAAEPGLPHWNPVLLKLPSSERLLLFYKVGSPISSWHTRVSESDDHGETWSEGRCLVEGDIGGRGPVKNKAITVEGGTILAPASIETADGKWDCFVDYSSDGGKSWTSSDYVKIDRLKWPGEGAIQPSLINRGNGKISMLARSSAGYVARADSEDSGQSWGNMYLTSLYNNNSGLDALKLENGTWLVVHNPIQQRWGPRTPLIISSSIDEGNSWKLALTLEDKLPPAGFTSIMALDTGIINDGESEFSYPAIIGDGHGGVYISYTYERVGIKHVHIDDARIVSLTGS